MKLHADALSRPAENPRLRVLSLGAGVQSTTLALMAARGDIEPPDHAIFADTQSEPSAVYRHLDWLETQLPFPVHRVTVGNLGEALKSGGQVNGRPPFFVRNPSGEVGFTRRQCTHDYKLLPIKKRTRELLGIPRGQAMRVFLGLKKSDPLPAVVEQWIGISLDEKQRLKDSRDPWIHNRHPLIEARMTRWDCKLWLSERQLPIPPKSACTFCPYHTNEMWRAIRDQDPESWEAACAVDEAVGRGVVKMKGEAFFHRSMKRLREAPIDEPDAPGWDFDNECEGMCGV